MQDRVKYDRRLLREWIGGATAGKIAITDFQRSFVWQKQRSADYVKAILNNKPVGIYLILEAAEKLQFKPRPFKGFGDMLSNEIGELVLDGQQRLTSLLQVLYGDEDYRFFVKMEDMSASQLSVEDVVFHKKGTGKEKELSNPPGAFAKNCIPMDVLMKDACREELKPLARWWAMVGEAIGDATKSRILEERAREFFDVNFFNRELWYCRLPSTVDARTAAEIFVDTNQSSVRISSFDVGVAVARGRYDEDLRATIKEAFDDRNNAVLRHYFKEDPEEWIPEIGEWMLKVACLNKGKQPRESDYGAGLDYLFSMKNEEETARNLEAIFSDLSWALEFAARLGGATKRTLPSWPPVHVLAALRRTYEAIKDPVGQNAARKLLEGYYWRCLFSNRYDMQANARLFGDFEALKEALDSIQKSGTYSERPPAFDDKDHPLYDADEFVRNAGWISGSRLGRALASVAMSSQPAPLDWITGKTLDIDRIRKLEQDGRLERHHIFPRQLLQGAQQARERINCALNGVLLERGTNRRFYKHPPKEYVEKTLKAAGEDIEEKEMRDRVESHLVPYDEMMTDGESEAVKEGYQEFLKKRADMLAREVVKLASLS